MTNLERSILLAEVGDIEIAVGVRGAAFARQGRRDLMLLVPALCRALARLRLLGPGLDRCGVGLGLGRGARSRRDGGRDWFDTGGLRVRRAVVEACGYDRDTAFVADVVVDDG